MALSYREMDETLMRELRLYHHPVAVRFLFSDEEVEEFKAKAPAYCTPLKPQTFCQWEVGARMRGKTVLGTVDKLFCTNAQCSFGWHDIDEGEVKSQLKYCLNAEQAERFLRSKPRLDKDSCRAVAVSPLGDAVLDPHVVHFYCDSLQAYHLACDYMAATDTHPLRTQILMSSSACGGCVWSWKEQTFNQCPPCSGSYNAGKTERGETNVFIPGSQIGKVVERLLSRISAAGSSSITKPGDPFPGGDICKNCPLVLFKDAK
ncbi:MAG: DUF169 domain-containing protein [Desulfovibrio sp.]|nr:DUF169 domain-containing protein [Desulfovibrio sp.]